MVFMPDNVDTLNLFQNTGQIPLGGLLIGSIILTMISYRLIISLKLGKSLNVIKVTEKMFRYSSAT